MNNIEKLDLQTPNFVNENIEKLAALFPHCVTETAEGKKIDFDLLQQELSNDIVDGSRERYRLEWPGKREAIVTANLPTTQTLRPVREDSVDFDNTENLYIEGDNLEVLKLLQESYFGKVKMIYIDPPYNTGNDFVYRDNFTTDRETELFESGQIDELNQRLVANPETSGRYHSDWLTMMYPRLKLARNLLTDDGVIFISINDKEIASLKKICEEVFGESNFIATLIWDRNHSAQAGIYKVYHEYILVFCKNADSLGTPQSLTNDLFEAGALKKESGRHAMQNFTFPKATRFDAPDGTELSGEWGGLEKVELVSGRMISNNGYLQESVTLRAAYTQISQMNEFFYGNKENLLDSRGQKITEFYLSSTGKVRIIKERGVEAPQTTCKFGSQGPISITLAALFETEDSPFDSPKPLTMIKDFVARFTDNDDFVLDFFAGSSTTAHAIMELNSENIKSKRKYICVQIQEDLDHSLLLATKDGKKTLQTAISYLTKNNLPHLLTEIGKERIRRAAKKIKTESGTNIDNGFRVYRLADSNMQDVYYRPQDYKQEQLAIFADNIKPDRSPDDLLAQVMLDWGLPLSYKIEQIDVNGKQVFRVAQDSLLACFDKGIDEAFAKVIAKEKPMRVVFRDSGFANDTAKINVQQLLKQLSPETEMKVI